MEADEYSVDGKSQNRKILNGLSFAPHFSFGVSAMKSIGKIVSTRSYLPENKITFVEASEEKVKEEENEQEHTKTSSDDTKAVQQGNKTLQERIQYLDAKPKEELSKFDILDLISYNKNNILSQVSKKDEEKDKEEINCSLLNKNLKEYANCQKPPDCKESFDDATKVIECHVEAEKKSSIIDICDDSSILNKFESDQLDDSSLKDIEADYGDGLLYSQLPKGDNNLEDKSFLSDSGASTSSNTYYNQVQYEKYHGNFNEQTEKLKLKREINLENFNKFVKQVNTEQEESLLKFRKIRERYEKRGATIKQLKSDRDEQLKTIECLKKKSLVKDHLLQESMQLCVKVDNFVKRAMQDGSDKIEAADIKFDLKPCEEDCHIHEEKEEAIKKLALNHLKQFDDLKQVHRDEVQGLKSELVRSEKLLEQNQKHLFDARADTSKLWRQCEEEKRARQECERQLQKRDEELKKMAELQTATEQDHKKQVEELMSRIEYMNRDYKELQTNHYRWYNYHSDKINQLNWQVFNLNGGRDYARRTAEAQLRKDKSRAHNSSKPRRWDLRSTWQNTSQNLHRIDEVLTPCGSPTPNSTQNSSPTPRNEPCSYSCNRDLVRNDLPTASMTYPVQTDRVTHAVSPPKTPTAPQNHAENLVSPCLRNFPVATIHRPHPTGAENHLLHTAEQKSSPRPPVLPGMSLEALEKEKSSAMKMAHLRTLPLFRAENPDNPNCDRDLINWICTRDSPFEKFPDSFDD